MRFSLGRENVRRQINQLNWHYFILLILLSFLFIVQNKGYFGYYFAGDGFNCFQWLRNIITGRGNYEGPTYEYVWANHSYITLPLIAPLIGVFPNPLILSYLSYFNLASSSLLLYSLSDWFLPRSRFGPLSLALTLSYLIHPLTLEAMSGFMMTIFQPETILPLSILALIVFFLKRKRHLFFLTFAFILLTKEEYIPISMAVTCWLLMLRYMLIKKIKICWQDVAIFSGVFLICSCLAIHVLLHYKALNDHIIVVRNASFATVLDWSSLWSGQVFDINLVRCAIFTALAPTGILLVILLLRQWKASLFLFISLLIFVFGRMTTDRLIYGLNQFSNGHLTPGLAWANWARIIIPVMMITSTMFAIRMTNRKVLTKKVAWMLSALSLVLALYPNVDFPPVQLSILKANRIFSVLGNAGSIQQHTYISSFFKNEEPDSLILIPNSCWEYFVYNLSFAQYPSHKLEIVEETFLQPYFKKWIDQATYVILLRSTATRKVVDHLLDFDQIAETQEYLLFKRDEKRRALINVKKRYW